ncbi:Nif3-like dinuclear metal center hexameric protein [Paenibacillus thermotolerans]|uniref:Nif3-like dinuclear metal center hexameric protein n=1 Tax=Paenibacillus thermotolerans TaxID=3027807 RepID=UPI002368D5FB|nr:MULTISPECIES: Nif3-like dinuclear metal center hexameric protein [unclassified Paenibacillus]
MSVRIKQVIDLLEQFCPPHLAEEGDPIGLQVGSEHNEVTRVSVALEVTEEVAEEAIRQGAQLIFAHHPIIYRPLKSLRTDQPAGKLLEKLLANRISVYVAHTNLDTAEGGINDMMAGALGLSGTVPLTQSHSEKLYKLVVFVPTTHLEAVSGAMFSAGAGHIGNYSHCSFTVEGFGTFMPQDGTDPFIGKQGVLEKVNETRIETIVTAAGRRAVVEAMLQAHPYEEVAYDLYAVELQGKSFGLGRIGVLPSPVSLEDFSESVKKAFEVPAVRVVGDLNRKVSKVAVLGGSGRSFLKQAISSGADVFVTGDIDHHTAHDALAAGLAIVDPGHHSEQIMKEHMSRWLNGQFHEKGLNVQAFPSSISTEPFMFR